MKSPIFSFHSIDAESAVNLIIWFEELGVAVALGSRSGGTFHIAMAFNLLLEVGASDVIPDVHFSSPRNRCFSQARDDERAHVR